MAYSKFNSSLTCHACSGKLGECLFAIDSLPLVDSFKTTSAEARLVPEFDIKIRCCEECQTVQIDQTVSPEILYRDYLYNSSSSPDLDKHFQEYAMMVKMYIKNAEAKILEIGVNDGLLIKKLKNQGFSDFTGIDPSPQSANLSLSGLQVVNDYFGQDVASNGVLKHKEYDVIIANNVFSHIEDLASIFGAINSLLSPKGLLIIEVQSLLHLIENCVFDYIYHEHIFYHTLSSIENLFALNGLEVVDVFVRPAKGGSYRIFIAKKGVFNPSYRVEYWKFKESIANLTSKKTWDKASSYLNDLRELTATYVNKFSRIGGYGASATGTVLQKLLLIENSLSYLVDDNQFRQGLYSPGSGIQVYSSEFIQPDDGMVILAWRHIAFFKNKIQNLNYLTPLPYYNEHCNDWH
jgi:2-polyprenyl-3-methyl-5-hydroxy-6-metoxy-1,4-benzoquinol methylase